MDIVVIAGGLSPERDVSLSSGSLIANALIENGHRVMLLDLYFGMDMDEARASYITKDCEQRYHYTVPSEEPDLAALCARSGNGSALVGKNVIEICRGADLAFLALHGGMGENGQLQAVFDAYGVRYTGTGYIGSALAMDKDISKKLMVNAGIPTPAWMLVDTGACDAGAIIKDIGLPCVVKPCSCGSSVGVSIVRSEGGLSRAVALAARYEGKMLIERLIEGREFAVGILDGAALPAIEIIPAEGFYDYKNKYQPGFTTEICPAKITESEAAALRDAALRTHEALRLGDYSRMDIILDANGGVHCLEANTLPGMTPTSLLPQEAAAAGISYGELCERIATLALSRR